MVIKGYVGKDNLWVPGLGKILLAFRRPSEDAGTGIFLDSNICVTAEHPCFDASLLESAPAHSGPVKPGSLRRAEEFIWKLSYSAFAIRGH